MKKILVFAIVLMFCFLSRSESWIYLHWNPNHDASLAGYKIYQAEDENDYVLAYPVPTNTVVTSWGETRVLKLVEGLVEGKRYRFAVTATNLASQESPYSTPLYYNVPTNPELILWPIRDGATTNIFLGDDGITYTNEYYVYNHLQIYWNNNLGILQYNTNLATTNWVTLRDSNSPGNPYIFISSAIPQAFFRLITNNVNPPTSPQTNTIFGNATIANYQADPNVTLGTIFYSTNSGKIVGLRYYKSTQNTGVHSGGIYSIDGVLLASGTFSNETSSGWQVRYLTTPLQISANTPYVVAYHTTVGYSYELNGLSVKRGTTNIFSYASSTDPKLIGNGRYKYGTSLSFPNLSWQSTSYGVDILFVKD